MDLTVAHLTGNREIDLDDEPDPVACECGRDWRFELWPGPDTATRFQARPPRWAPPSVNPCQACRGEHTDAELAKRIERAQRAAGIGERDRAWSWDRTLIQTPGEDLAGFRVRVSDEWSPHIGILRRNIEAARVVAKWTPKAGHSIYLMGGVGTGKTLFASALANRLLIPAPRIRDVWTLDELKAPKPVGQGLNPTRAQQLIDIGRNVYFQSSPAWAVSVIPENELYERVKLGWQKDKAPLAKISDVDALILDDLGEVGHDPKVGDQSGRPQPPGSQEGIQRLIRYRYQTGQHLVITSNVPFRAIRDGATIRRSGILERYGARVFDRLCEMCGDHVYSLGGDSWRDR